MNFSSLSKLSGLAANNNNHNPICGNHIKITVKVCGNEPSDRTKQDGLNLVALERNTICIKTILKMYVGKKQV